MTFTPVGTWQLIEPSAGDTTLTVQNVGDLVPVVVLANPATVWCTGISGGGCTWTQAGPVVQGAVVPTWSGVAFLGKVVTPGTATCTLSFNGTFTSMHSRFQEFKVTSGQWASGAEGHIDSGGTADWAALTASEGGELYYGYAANNGDAVAGTQPGWTYAIDSDGNGIGYNPDSGPGAVQAVWGDSGQHFGAMVLIREAASGLLMAAFP